MPAGWRAFQVHVDFDTEEVFLQPASNGATMALEYPLVRAVCRTTNLAGTSPKVAGQHSAPQNDCNCGYHCYTDRAGAFDWNNTFDTGFRRMFVMAEVWGYGRVEAHEFGFRAERLQLVRFYWPTCEVQSCDSAASVAVVHRIEPRHDGYAAGGYPHFVHAFCDFCHAERPVKTHYERSGAAMRLVPDEVYKLARVWPVAKIMQSLADKFKASIYSFDQTEDIRAENSSQEWIHRPNAGLKRQEQEREAREARRHEYQRQQKANRERYDATRSLL